MPTFPLSSKTIAVLTRAVVDSNTHTTMTTMFFEAGIDQWAESGPNKESQVQRLLANLRKDGGQDAARGAMELARLMLERGKAVGAWGQPKVWWQGLYDALAADGWEFDVGSNTFVPTVPGASIVAESSWIDAELARRGWVTTAGHYKQAIDSFARGNWAAANSQLRTFFGPVLGFVSPAAK